MEKEKKKEFRSIKHLFFLISMADGSVINGSVNH